MVKTIFGQNKIDKILFSIKTYGIKHLFSIINRRLKSLYMIDRYEISCVKNLFKLTTQVIEEHSISRILVMTPPFSMYKLALKIKKKFNQIPLIIDIQDSWVIPALKNINTLVARRSRKIERNSILLADGVAFNIPVMKKSYDEFYQIGHKSNLFMNGFDFKYHKNNQTNKPISLELNKSKLNIGYFGKIHIGNDEYFRDIRKFFDFFKLAEDKFKKNIHLDIYGHFSGDYKSWLSKVPFAYKGHLNFSDVFDYMKQYDILMLFHSDKTRAEEVLTGKVFEYLYAKKPIMVLGPENMIEARNLIEKNELGIFVNIFDKNDIIDKLNFLVHLKRKNELSGFYNQNFDLKNFDREIINLKYLSWVNQFKIL